MIWEYEVVSKRYSTAKTLKRDLNSYGEKGWELISTVADEIRQLESYHETELTKVMCVFKRLKENS